MKKITTLFLAAGMIWSVAAPSAAHAVDVKFSGTMDFTFERRNAVLDADTSFTNNLDALQRLRLGMDFIASENLSAYYMLQVGTGLWGSSAKNSKFGQDFAGGHQSAPGQSRISTRFMYLDWVIPGTQAKVRMGKQDISLPSFAFDVNPVQNGPVAGAHINVPVNDTLAVNAYWARPAANERTDNAGIADNRFRNVDMFGLVVPMNFDGFAFVPFTQVASIGNAYGETGYAISLGMNRGESVGETLTQGTSNAWWLGFAARMTKFDPFTVSLDFAYGAQNAHGKPNQRLILNYKNGGTASTSTESINDRSGWLAALKMDYKTAWGVPTLLTWYSSGDGSGIGRSGRMPFTTDDQASSVAVASTYFDYGWSLGAGAAVADITGTWGVSLAWKEFSFMEDLFHDFSVTYLQGTNNKANVYTANNPANPYTQEYFFASSSPADGYLTTKDSAIDVTLSSTYAIYTNLAANLELGYLFQNFDRNIRATYLGDGTLVSKPDFQNIWRVAVNFKYTF